MFIFIIENLYNTNNCKQILNSNYKSEKLFNLEKPKGFFFDNVIDNFCASTSIIVKNNILNCYYTNVNQFNIRKTLSLSCLSFDLNTNTILSIKNDILEGMICLNFAIIKFNNTLKIIGGHHVKQGIHWRDYHKNCEFCKNIPTVNISNLSFINDKGNFLMSNIFNKCHLNGLYVIGLDDKKYLNHLPVLSINSPHITSTQGIHFDTNLSVIYNKNIKKYILYTRSNIKLGTRFVSYSMSSDLINWEPFKYLNCSKYDYDINNYYYFSVFNYYDIYVSFPLYADLLSNQWKNSGIKVMTSNDGYTQWNDLGYFIKRNKPVSYLEHIQNKIVGINLTNINYDEIFENVNHQTSQEGITSHKFPKYAMIGLTNIDKNVISHFDAKININKENKLIADIEEEGFITVTFDNISYNFTATSNKPFIISTNKENIYMTNFLFKKATIFSIL